MRYDLLNHYIDSIIWFNDNNCVNDLRSDWNEDDGHKVALLAAYVGVNKERHRKLLYAMLEIIIPIMKYVPGVMQSDAINAVKSIEDYLAGRIGLIRIENIGNQFLEKALKITEQPYCSDIISYSLWAILYGVGAITDITKVPDVVKDISLVEKHRGFHLFDFFQSNWSYYTYSYREHRSLKRSAEIIRRYLSFPGDKNA